MDPTECDVITAVLNLLTYVYRVNVVSRAATVDYLFHTFVFGPLLKITINIKLK